jgi:hypothetical protein
VEPLKEAELLERLERLEISINLLWQEVVYVKDKLEYVR